MDKLVLRKFNEDGIRKFRRLLREENFTNREVLRDILTDASYAQKLDVKVEIDVSTAFEDRYELGEYFHSHLKSIGDSTNQNYGIWTWLACAFMDTICPVAKMKSFGDDVRYVPSELLGVPIRFYRHLIRGPYSVIKSVADDSIDDDFAKLLLRNKPWSPGDFYETCYSRSYIRRSKVVQKAIIDIYGNSKGGLKSGCNTHNKGGGLRRFAKTIIPRVQENFDVERASTELLIKAWGDEIKSSKFMPDNLKS